VIIRVTENDDLRPPRRLGKYRLERTLGQSLYSHVFQALDTVEGVRVALKVPHRQWVSTQVLEDFRREARMAARLLHPHILPLKNAEFIDGYFVIAYPLGERTLADRLQRRMSLATALRFAEQMISAVAHAHQHRIIHCDVKPENFILFRDNTLRLTDFGIAKVAYQTLRASGSGTVGYVAPEQAMGRPGFHSDVFSLGLILYRMLAGHLPEWPYEWPPPGWERLRRRVHPAFLDFLRRAMAVDPRKRFANAVVMLRAFRRIKSRALRYSRRRATANDQTGRDWRVVRTRQFLRQFGAALEARHQCGSCQGPVSEPMLFCPWCGAQRAVHEGGTTFPATCSRCHRGLKADWRYCPWCYGPGVESPSVRAYSDRRYVARCSAPHCKRKELMAFMRYCPWCNRKVRRKWKIPGSSERCPACRWGVLKEYWTFCPWCGKHLQSP
jgi:serine/threonine-protein kinase